MQFLRTIENEISENDSKECLMPANIEITLAKSAVLKLSDIGLSI